MGTRFASCVERSPSVGGESPITTVVLEARWITIMMIQNSTRSRLQNYFLLFEFSLWFPPSNGNLMASSGTSCTAAASVIFQIIWWSSCEWNEADRRGNGNTVETCMILWWLWIRQENSKYSLISCRSWWKATSTWMRWNHLENVIGMQPEPCLVVSRAAGVAWMKTACWMWWMMYRCPFWMSALSRGQNEKNIKRGGFWNNGCLTSGTNRFSFPPQSLKSERAILS